MIFADGSQAMMDLSQERNLKVERVQCHYDFQSSFIYKSLKWSFQYADCEDQIFRSRGRKILFYFCQIIVLALGWTYFLYESYHSYKVLKQYELQASFFSFVIYVIYYVLYLMQKVGTQTIGIYTLKRYPSLIEHHIDALEVLNAKNNVGSTDEIYNKIKKRERHIYDLIAFCSVILLLVPLVYTIWGEVQMLGKPSYAFLDTIRLLAYFSHWLASMPFLFYIIFLAQIQMIHLRSLSRMIQNGYSGIDIFAEYRKIHDSVAYASRSSSLYLVFTIISVGFLCSVGTYTIVASTIEAAKGDIAVSVIMDFVFGAFIFVSQIILVNLFPLITLSKVGIEEKKIVSVLLNADQGQLSNHSPFSIAHSIDLLQRVEGVGYKVLGSPITKWKTIVWLLIGPFAKFFISKVL